MNDNSSIPNRVIVLQFIVLIVRLVRSHWKVHFKYPDDALK